MEDITRAHALLSDLKLSRNSLMGQASATARTVRIDILRNHSFELVASTLDAFLGLSEIRSDVRYSDYDDAFSGAGQSKDADLLLIWVDLDRYDTIGRALLIDRFGGIADRAECPVLLAPVSSDTNIGDALSKLSPRLRVVDLIQIRDRLGAAFFDERLADFTGTRCSLRASLEASRLIGASEIPSAFQPALKAVVVDLDNTLYAGVLGEDGIRGVTLNAGHVALQQTIEKLAGQGIFVCVVSKNEKQDVEELFEIREDFPLKRASITMIMANWNPKSDNISLLETALNIHHSAMLFIDDNMGELFEVRRVLSGIRLLWASPDAEANARALSIYPCLKSVGPSLPEDKIRSCDVQANEKRRRWQTEMSSEDYLRSLEVKIEFCVDRLEYAARVTSLANKTNQFIFNYGRYTYAKIEQAISSVEKTVVTAQMSDKLVNSGIIGAAVVERHNDTLVVDDLFISCRALGRGLDDVVVLGLLKIAQDHLGSDLPLRVEFKAGPRNSPAQTFIESNLRSHVVRAEPFTYNFPSIPIHIVTPRGEIS